MLCELETDKVTVEVPATAAGVLAEIVAAEGETVGVDALLATIDEKADAKPRRRPRSPPPSRAAAKAAAEAPPAKAEPASDAEAPPRRRAGVDVMVPTLGESVTEATVSTWFKTVGDAVAVDEMLCELETDKVSVEVPSPAAGRLGEILAEAGATVAAGGKLGRDPRRRRRRRAKAGTDARRSSPHVDAGPEHRRPRATSRTRRPPRS